MLFQNSTKLEDKKIVDQLRVIKPKDVKGK